MNATTPAAVRASLIRSLIYAGLFLGISYTLGRMSPEYVSHEVKQRLLGVMSGVLVIVYANAVPKMLTPLVRLQCSPVAEQSLRRLTGWSLVLGGAAFALAWTFVPLEYANIIAMMLLGSSVLVVMGAVAMRMMQRTRA